MMPSSRPLRWEEMHYRLVSLWDVLDMYALKAGQLLEAVNWLTALMQRLAGPDTRGPTENMTCRAEVLIRMKEKAEFVRVTAADLQIKGLASAAERLIAVIGLARIGDPQPDLATFFLPDAVTLFSQMRLLHGRVADDFSDQTVLVVPLNKRDLYQPDEPNFGAQFGTEVARKFKSKGKHEIGEAANCLALGRDTACVFHLMRGVEAAIEAIRLSLGLPDPTKGQHKAWGAVLGRFQEEIDKRNEDRAWPRQWSSLEDKRFFEQVQMALVAIKDGCRDDTMHVESTYNERQARHLYALTQGFMEKIASRLDENGHPLAY